MSTVKTAGFLRIWKVFLFMMAMVLFAACFGNTALAASSWQFNYTGNVQSWTCPATGTYKLEVWGAQAGYNYYDWEHRSANGAQGGYASGTMNITKGTTLYICVGGRGGSTSTWDPGAGGYNGGGAGGRGESHSAGAGSGGGGATHIATTNRGVLSNYVSSQNEVLIVAGGGGGCAYACNGSPGGDGSRTYQFGQGQNGIAGVWNAHEGGGGGGGGWYGGSYGLTGGLGNGRSPAYGGSHYTSSQLSNVTKQNGGHDGNGFARIASMHTHNSSGVEYNQGNGSQHIKYTYCNGHGSDHSQNRNATWENHTWTTTKDWYNYDNTTMHQEQKCSLCGRTRVNSKTRTYWVNISVLDPDNVEHTAASTGIGYFRVSNDGINWSDLYYDQPDTLSYIGYAEYGSKIYIQYVKSATQTLEFKAIKATYNCLLRYLTSTGDLEKHQLTGGSDLTKVGDNTWVYTVTNDTVNGMTSGQCIHIYMDYKHTTLTLNPNGGSINGSTEAQALSPQLQYSTAQWNNLSTKEPSRAGYTFTGWYDAPTGGTMVYDAQGKCIRSTAYFDKNGNSLCTSNLTVYAHWIPTKYQIKYILFKGSAEKVIEYTIEDTVKIPNASLNGYDFIGWTMSCKNGSVGDGNKTISANVSVPTKDLVIKGLYGDLTLTANYTKTEANTDGGHNKTPDDDGTPDHITDTGGRKTPLVTDGGTKHNMFRVTSARR